MRVASDLELEGEIFRFFLNEFFSQNRAKYSKSFVPET